MTEIDDESIHLMITSPPYNVGKEYESDQSFDEWLTLCRNVFAEVKRVMVLGGRIAINVAGTGRNPYRPLQNYLGGIMLDLGLLMRGEIIWVKGNKSPNGITGASVGSSTAWGSWKSASNPCLRDVHEYILVFSKSCMKRERTGPDTIERDDFLECTKSVWHFPTAPAKKIGHPSPFPLELPRRLIELYSFENDIILDPFSGSGQTCIAALSTGRRYVGYDIMPEYCVLARSRIEEAVQKTDGQKCVAS
ncbi:DNA-methyltransferase [Thermodesulfobacteriota bacterium]